jgi:hypothetical protein
MLTEMEILEHRNTMLRHKMAALQVKRPSHERFRFPKFYLRCVDVKCPAAKAALDTVYQDTA